MRRAMSAEQAQAQLLIGEHFGMLERHVQKHFLDRCQIGRKQVARDAARPFVAGKCARITAKNVARELIEHQHPPTVRSYLLRHRERRRARSEGIGKEQHQRR